MLRDYLLKYISEVNGRHEINCAPNSLQPHSILLSTTKVKLQWFNYPYRLLYSWRQCSVIVQTSMFSSDVTSCRKQGSMHERPYWTCCIAIVFNACTKTIVSVTSLTFGWWCIVTSFRIAGDQTSLGLAGDRTTCFQKIAWDTSLLHKPLLL